MTSWRLPLVKTGVIVWLSLIKTAQLSKKSRLNEILFGIQKFQEPTFLSSFQPFWEFWENLSRGAEPNNFQVASSKRCLWISIFFLRNFGKELKFQRDPFFEIPGTRCASAFAAFPSSDTVYRVVENMKRFRYFMPQFTGNTCALEVEASISFFGWRYFFFFFLDWCSASKRLCGSDLGKKQVFGYIGYQSSCVLRE